MIFISDVLSHIFEYLDTKQLIYASRVCKKWRKVYNDNISKYKFELCVNWRKYINDNDLKYLQGAGVHNITDDGLKYLKNCKVVWIYFNDNITSKGVEFLKNCDRTIFSYCSKLKD